MAVSIKGTTIIMTRGDSLKTHIKITDACGKEYIPVEGDTIRFALKKDYDDYSPIIVKDIPYDTCDLILDPCDTKKLELSADYVYDIQITLSDGTVDTFIDRGKFKTTEEVD